MNRPLECRPGRDAANTRPFRYLAGPVGGGPRDGNNRRACLIRSRMKNEPPARMTDGSHALRGVAQRRGELRREAKPCHHKLTTFLKVNQ